MKNLYGFASDYPGIRHAGTPANALRAIEMRDMVAMAILMVGFTPYLTDRFDADATLHQTLCRLISAWGSILASQMRAGATNYFTCLFRKVLRYELGE